MQQYTSSITRRSPTCPRANIPYHSPRPILLDTPSSISSPYPSNLSQRHAATASSASTARAALLLCCRQTHLLLILHRRRGLWCVLVDRRKKGRCIWVCRSRRSLRGWCRSRCRGLWARRGGRPRTLWWLCQIVIKRKASEGWHCDRVQSRQANCTRGVDSLEGRRWLK